MSVITNYSFSKEPEVSYATCKYRLNAGEFDAQIRKREENYLELPDS